MTTDPHAPVIWPYRLAMAVIWAGTVTMLTTMMYLIWPSPAVYISEPIPVENARKEVAPGGVLYLVLSYDKPFDNETFVGIMIANRGTIWLLPATLAALPPSTETEHGHTIRIPVPVPREIPQGEYVAIVSIVHPVRLPLPTFFHKAVRAHSEPFTVIGHAPPDGQ